MTNSYLTYTAISALIAFFMRGQVQAVKEEWTSAFCQPGRCGTGECVDEGLNKRFCICKEGTLGDQCEFDLNANGTRLFYSVIGLDIGKSTFDDAKAACASEQRTLLTGMTESVKLALSNYSLVQDYPQYYLDFWVDRCYSDQCQTYRIDRTLSQAYYAHYVSRLRPSSNIAICQRARKICPRLRFGKNCEKNCTCYNGGYCDDITGNCICPGYGSSVLNNSHNDCRQKCRMGRYGNGCNQTCQCPGGMCSPVSGQCICTVGTIGPNCTNNINKDVNNTDSVIVNHIRDFKYSQARAFCHKRRQQLPKTVHQSTQLTLLSYMKTEGRAFYFQRIWLNDCNSLGRCKALHLNTKYPRENGIVKDVLDFEHAFFDIVLCTDANGLACQRGWYGIGCLQICMCHNGGTCANIDGHCSCTAGYTGRYCEQTLLTFNDFSQKNWITNMNLAALDCYNKNGVTNGVWRTFNIKVPSCNDLDCPFRSDMTGNFYSGFKSGSKAGSMCLSWYPQSRSLISHTFNCIDSKSCTRYMNSATCQFPTNANQPMTCSCGPNWHGAFCERENVCYTRNPCKNGGTCVPSDDGIGYRCYCPSYSHGDRCEKLDRECRVVNRLHSAASAVLYYYYIPSPLGSNTVADMCKRRGAEVPLFIPRTHCRTFSGHFFKATSQSQAICQRPLQICKGFGTLQVPKGHHFNNTVTFADAHRLCKQSDMLSIPWSFRQSLECASRLVLRMQKLYNLTSSQTPKIWWWQDRFRNENRTVLCWVYRSNELVKGEHHDEYQMRNGTLI